MLHSGLCWFHLQPSYPIYNFPSNTPRNSLEIRRSRSVALRIGLFGNSTFQSATEQSQGNVWRLRYPGWCGMRSRHRGKRSPSRTSRTRQIRSTARAEKLPSGTRSDRFRLLERDSELDFLSTNIHICDDHLGMMLDQFPDKEYFFPRNVRGRFVSARVRWTQPVSARQPFPLHASRKIGRLVNRHRRGADGDVAAHRGHLSRTPDVDHGNKIAVTIASRSTFRIRAAGSGHTAKTVETFANRVTLLLAPSFIILPQGDNVV
jgi:hypothetical protein